MVYVSTCMKKLVAAVTLLAVAPAQAGLFDSMWSLAESGVRYACVYRGWLPHGGTTVVSQTLPNSQVSYEVPTTPVVVPAPVMPQIASSGTSYTALAVAAGIGGALGLGYWYWNKKSLPEKRNPGIQTSAQETTNASTQTDNDDWSDILALDVSRNNAETQTTDEPKKHAETQTSVHKKKLKKKKSSRKKLLLKNAALRAEIAKLRKENDELDTLQRQLAEADTRLIRKLREHNESLTSWNEHLAARRNEIERQRDALWLSLNDESVRFYSVEQPVSEVDRKSAMHEKFAQQSQPQKHAERELDHDRAYESGSDDDRELNAMFDRDEQRVQRILQQDRETAAIRAQTDRSNEEQLEALNDLVKQADECLDHTKQKPQEDPDDPFAGMRPFETYRDFQAYIRSE